MDLLASYDDDGDKSQSSNTNKQDQVRFGHRVNDIFLHVYIILCKYRMWFVYQQNGGFVHFHFKAEVNIAMK